MLVSSKKIALPSASNITASIAISTLNPDVIYIVANNKVYRSADAGAFWTDFSPTLPINFESVYIDPYSTIESVYLITDFGVYYADYTLPDWVYLNNGFPDSTENPTATFYQIIPGSSLYKGSNSATSHISFGTWGAGFQKVNFYTQKCDQFPQNIYFFAFGPGAASLSSVCYTNNSQRAGYTNDYSVSTSASNIGGNADQ